MHGLYPCLLCTMLMRLLVLQRVLSTTTPVAVQSKPTARFLFAIYPPIFVIEKYSKRNRHKAFLGEGRTLGISEDANIGQAPRCSNAEKGQGGTGSRSVQGSLITHSPNDEQAHAGRSTGSAEVSVSTQRDDIQQGGASTAAKEEISLDGSGRGRTVERPAMVDCKSCGKELPEANYPLHQFRCPGVRSNLKPWEILPAEAKFEDRVTISRRKATFEQRSAAASVKTVTRDGVLSLEGALDYRRSRLKNPRTATRRADHVAHSLERNEGHFSGRGIASRESANAVRIHPNEENWDHTGCIPDNLLGGEQGGTSSLACRFCGLSFQKVDAIASHEDFCGARTERCDQCCGLVPRKNVKTHGLPGGECDAIIAKAVEIEELMVTGRDCDGTIGQAVDGRSRPSHLLTTIAGTRTMCDDSCRDTIESGESLGRPGRGLGALDDSLAHAVRLSRQASLALQVACAKNDRLCASGGISSLMSTSCKTKLLHAGARNKKAKDGVRDQSAAYGVDKHNQTDRAEKEKSKSTPSQNNVSHSLQTVSSCQPGANNTSLRDAADEGTDLFSTQDMSPAEGCFNSTRDRGDGVDISRTTKESDKLESTGIERCGSRRMEPQRRDVEASSSESWKCLQCTLCNPSHIAICSACGLSMQTEGARSTTDALVKSSSTAVASHGAKIRQKQLAEDAQQSRISLSCLTPRGLVSPMPIPPTHLHGIDFAKWDSNGSLPVPANSKLHAQLTEVEASASSTFRRTLHTRLQDHRVSTKNNLLARSRAPIASSDRRVRLQHTEVDSIQMITSAPSGSLIRPALEETASGSFGRTTMDSISSVPYVSSGGMALDSTLGLGVIKMSASDRSRRRGHAIDTRRTRACMTHASTRLGGSSRPRRPERVRQRFRSRSHPSTPGIESTSDLAANDSTAECIPISSRLGKASRRNGDIGEDKFSSQRSSYRARNQALPGNLPANRFLGAGGGKIDGILGRVNVAPVCDMSLSVVGGSKPVANGISRRKCGGGNVDRSGKSGAQHKAKLAEKRRSRTGVAPIKLRQRMSNTQLTRLLPLLSA